MNEENNILKWNITTIAAAIEKKLVSPVELTKMTIEEIAKRNGKLNAYITVTEEIAMKEALAAEKAIQKGYLKGPLHGIPIAIKDNIAIQNVNNTLGSEIYKDFISNKDADVIKMLRNAGAIIVGKTNMQEFAAGTTGVSSYFGATRNLYDISKMAGGSSSGSGSAVSSYLAYGAIGSDTGGSIRIPSSFCGIVGMKPTFGLVSKHGVFPLSKTMDHIGPMTRSVKDNAIMLNALAHYDDKRRYSVKRVREDFTQQIGKTITGLTIGIPSNYFYEVLQSDVRQSMNDIITLLDKYGVKFIPVELKYADQLSSIYTTIAGWESLPVFKKDLQKHPEKIQSDVRSRLMGAYNINKSDYLHSQKTKCWFVEDLKSIFKQVDVILTPTTPVLPAFINQEYIDIENKRIPLASILGKLTSPFNVVGFPSLSMPAPLKNGLPVGIQLVGEPFSEKKLYRFADFIERILMKSS